MGVRPLTTTLTIGIPNFGAWAGGDWHQLIDVARACDEAGVDRVVVNDHVVMGNRTDRYIWGRFPTKPDGPWLEPLTVLSAMAMVTQRVRLATGVLIAPLRPAPLLAKTIGTLDTISGGRVDLGVGTGWQPEEYDALNLSFDDRAQRLDDTIAACRELWSTMPASYASATTTFSDTYCAPQPVQQRLPIWFAGALTKRNLTRIVELGDGWIPIMGASLEDIGAGAARIKDATDRPIVVQAPLPMETDAEGNRDPAASMAHAAELIEAGVTDIYVNVAAFAASPAGASDAAHRTVAAFRGATCVSLSLDPSGDISEIRQLIERYAGAVDRGDATGAAELFIEDGDLDMWLDPTSPDSTARRHGRAEITKSLGMLERFTATQHLIGSCVVDVNEDDAIAHTQCTAHHLETDGDGYIDRVLHIVYVDTFTRVDAQWRFARRELRVRWTAVLPVESV